MSLRAAERAEKLYASSAIAKHRRAASGRARGGLDVRFSANLGFLWTDLALDDAIRAAAAAGFAAVECHWPFEMAPERVAAALSETGLPMLSLNTSRGNVAAGDRGLAAVPGRETEARGLIDAAVDYAAAVGARAVHVMAGWADGPRARACFCDNLRYACDRAAGRGVTVLVEPLNTRDAPGYFLSRTCEAAGIIADVARPNLRLMFDCYHVQIMEGDVTRRFSALFPLIGHVQIASIPDRGPPDGGELDYGFVLDHIARSGWTAPVGAEYAPPGPTDESLGWMSTLVP